MSLSPQPRPELDAAMRRIGDRVKELRLALGAGQRSLAAAAGVHENTIQRIEGGDSPTLRNMLAVAHALGTTVGRLLQEAGVEG